MINKYTNKQRGLLAVIMAMVMVFAGAAFVAAEVDATIDYDNEGKLTTDVELSGTESLDGTPTAITINGNGKTISIGSDDKLNVSGTVIFNGVIFATYNSTVSDDVDNNHAGQIMIAAGSDVTFNNCTFTGDGEFAMNASGTVSFTGNTDLNGKKVVIKSNLTSLTMGNNVEGMYLNMDTSITVYNTAPSTATIPYFVIPKDVTIDQITLRQGQTFTLDTNTVLNVDKLSAYKKDGNEPIITGGTLNSVSVVPYELDNPNHPTSGSTPERIEVIDIRGVKFTGNNTFAEDIAITSTTGGITIDKDSKLSVQSDISGITNITNNGTIFVTSEEGKLPTTIAGTGSVDSSSVQEDAYFGGSIVTKDTVFSSNQIVNIVADTELKDALLIIKGTLIVPEGVTLTLSGTSAIWIYGAESKLYNNGTIIVASEGKQSIGEGTNKIDPRPVIAEPDNGSKGLVALGIYGGYAENNGDIYLSYEPEDETGFDCFDSYALHIQEAVFENNGNIQIDEFNTLGINVKDSGDKTILNNNERASMTVEGVLIGYVDNASTITIDGTAWAFVSLVTSDAVIDIVSLQTMGTGLAIDNEGLFIKKDVYVEASDDDDNKVKAKSSVTLTTTSNGTYTYAIEGLTVGTAFIYDKEDTEYYYPYIDISGAVSGETTEEGTANATVNVGDMTFTNDVRVTTALSIPDEIDMIGTGKLTVSGEMTLDVGTFSIPTVTVTGKLVSTEELPVGTTLIASYYEIKEDKVNNIAEQHIYTNFADAVSVAPKKITVFGDVEVSTEITVPAGIEITFENGKLTVTSDGRLSVADGSKMKLAAVGSDVKGVLHFENKKNLNGEVTSDVVITDDKSVTYCGIAYAMANATAGQTVTVSEGAADPLEIEKDVTIPAGVILDTGAVDEVKVCKGATLTIDGTLDLGAAEITIEPADVPQTAAGAKPAGKVVLNGTIVSEDEQDAEIPGAYYTMTVKGVTGYYIEPVATAAPKIATVDDLTMEIMAFDSDLALGDVSFTGTTEDSAVVKIVGKVNGNITLDLASVEFGDYAFKGTITNGTGTFASEGAATTGFKVKSTTTDDVKKLTVSGTFTAGSMKTITLSGDVTLSKFTGNSVTVDGNVVVIDTSSDDGVSTITSKLKVNGTVTVDNDATLTVYGIDSNGNVISYAEVLGSLTAVSATDSKGAGKVNVTDLYLGLTKKMVTGAGAAISENVSVSGYIYVVDGSAFPADMVKDKKYVALYVEDALWMTVYYMGADSEPVIEISEVPIENVELVDWVDDKGVSKTKDTAGGEDTFTIDVNNQKLYAKINYNVYLVKFSVSEGIDDIYIDGVLVDTIENVKAKFVAAGQHTVSYTLANGYTGEAKMLVDGKEVSGYTFTTEGEFENVTYTITLQGIEKAPAEVGGGDAPSADEDEGMDLTDILLIVLVVLIVIMAIIVALRMMRS